MDDREEWRERVREIRAAARHDDDDWAFSFILAKAISVQEQEKVKIIFYIVAIYVVDIYLLF